MTCRTGFPTPGRLGLAAALAASLLLGCATEFGSPVLERPPGGGRDAGTAAAPVPGAGAASQQGRPDAYTVQKGDTLFGIAKRFGVPYKELGEWNGVDSRSGVKVGQQLRLNPPDSPVVAYAVKVDAPPEGKVVPDDSVPLKPAEIKAGGGPVPGVPGPVPPGVATVGNGGGGAIAKELPAIPAMPTEPAAKDGQGVPSPSAVAPEAAVKTEPKAVKLPYSATALAQLQKSADAAPLQKSADVPQGPEGAAAPKAPAIAKPGVALAAKAEAAPKPAGDAGAQDGDSERIEWVWPTQGKVASAFNESTKGITLAGTPGQPVVASASGFVTYVGSDLRGYGRMVVIKHNKTFLSVYTNNSQVLVKEHQSVARGQKIAEMGSGGDGDAVALHFEIRRLGKPVDPMKYLPNDRS